MDSIVNLAVGKIREILVQEAKFLHGVEHQFESLQEELIMMNGFLNEMESLDEESRDERIHNITKQIRRIAYDAEDVIESYILEVVNPAENKDLLKRFLCFFKCLVNTHKAGTEIGSINARIAHTMELLKKYPREASGGGKGWRPAVYSHSNYDDYVVGLDEDIKKLVGFLIEKKSQIQVLSVAGMGGSGKTTLVRKLYNHESVKQCFESTTWVPISYQWVAQQGMLDLFKRITDKELEEARGPQAAGEKIHKYLEGKKYLIVLDDVWTKQALEEILTAFPMGNNGSKIIVTTRYRQVVGYPTSKVSIHESRGLTAEESWELFRKICLNQDQEERTNISLMDFVAMEELGKEMLTKCKGLPLAIVALAGLLSRKETLEDWEKVKKAMSSMVMETGRGTEMYGAVGEMLTLSYTNLPRDLKPCFLYLGLFPEDTQIPTGMLIRMWIAEGFILASNLQDGETLEDLGREYLNELIGRCVVRVTSRNYDGKAKTIEVHDLMRDLCIKKAKKLDFLETLSGGSFKPINTVTQARRAVVHSNDDKVFLPFSTSDRHLRSLFLFSRGVQLSSFQSVLDNLKLLTVLSLEGIKTCDGTIPKEIGSLILLRYLGLRNTNIPQLPSSVGNLHNLLTLDYKVSANTSQNNELTTPNVLWQIEGLRHVYLPIEMTLEEMRFDSLLQLQTLSIGGGSWVLDQLPKLSTSFRRLHIQGIQSNVQLEVALFRCPSIRSDSLHSLKLDWRGETTLRNFEHIVRNRHLRNISLIGRIDDRSGNVKFPIGVKKLILIRSTLQEEATLAALGRLANLKCLLLSTYSYMGAKWTCSKGMFPHLKELTLSHLPNLVEGAMLRLAKLSIFFCAKLERIPKGLKFITTLQELEIDWMPADFIAKLRKGRGEDAHIIQHIPVVRLNERM